MTIDLIESTIAALPVQGRIMLRLLLLSYFDVTKEDCDFMAADQPDSRMLSGKRLPTPVVPIDRIKAVVERVAQYRRYVRIKRERAWLQVEGLQKLIQLNSARSAVAADLLRTRFEVPTEKVEELKREARTMVPKPALRSLDQQWDRDEIEEEAYRKSRLCLEFQFLVRRIERERRLLDIAERELQTISHAPLQDHEIGHIWGIPAGTLMARKVKFLSAYMQALQRRLSGADALPRTQAQTPIDLWKETFTVLSRQPVERSLAQYDGLEQTEDAFMVKLQAFVAGRLPEDVQTKFWLSLGKGGSSNAVHAEEGWSVFGLQKLSAVLTETDQRPEALEEELLALVSPQRKLAPGELPPPATEKVEINEMAQHVLNSMFGEVRSANEPTR
ncbi:MAG: hypothetical protein NW703_03750 [Nitrospiraceae bacterium]